MDSPKPALKFLWISKRILEVPDPRNPKAVLRVPEKHGRTFVNPHNKLRLRGKSNLRIAKAARVAQRIQDFNTAARKRGLFVSDSDPVPRRRRDKLLSEWRAAA
jgi:hypothetical protein